MFSYFGYGSNLDQAALRAKGVTPRASIRGVLRGYRLRFNVRHWFAHEGGVGNIEATAGEGDAVLGLVHECDDEHLHSLDALESRGTGYDRIEVDVETGRGAVRAFTYTGLPALLDDALLPTRRYLNIVVRGAAAAGLDDAYVERLRAHAVFQVPFYPPFTPPPLPVPVPEFDAASLAGHPSYTALLDAVFDTTGSRPLLGSLNARFAGRDATLFHLHRHDTSDGSETLEDVRAGRVAEAARAYLNAYLHAYAADYRYVGRYRP